jgi:hypothetical protein
MNRKILNLLFISLISVCLIVGFLGRAALAADEPTRSGQAYEEERTCVGGICYYTGRQYTSQYDLMRGEIYPNVTVSYTTPDIQGLYTGSASSQSRGSAIGGLFTGPSMRFPTSPFSYMLGTMGAPQYETAQSVSPWTGSMSYSSSYAPMGFGGAGFALGPFRYTGYSNPYSGSGYTGYSTAGYGGGGYYGGGYFGGGLFGGGLFGGGGGYGLPTRLY